jgi:hypothetical protein
MPDTATGGIQIGDAVVNFIGDMTQLDQGVDKLNDRIESWHDSRLTECWSARGCFGRDRREG